MTETWFLSAGGLKLPVKVEKRGKKFSLQFRRYDPLKEEIKAMTGAEFDNDTTAWLVTDNARNRMQLAMLRGEKIPEIERYYQPYLEVRPRRKNLREHQVQIFQHELSTRRCVISAEQGTGKTLPTIEAMEKIGGEWWWVGPKKVLDTTRLEFKKWDAKIEPEFCSYHMLRKMMKKGRKAPKGVVFDESAYLKNPESDWTAAAQHLCNAIREENDGYVFELSGMPDPNEPTDWWAQAEVACPGFLRESSVNRLRRRLIKVLEYGQTPSGQEFAQEWEWIREEIELLGRRLKGLVLVIRADDCQDLPELVEEIWDLPPTPAALRAARLLAHTSINTMQALDKCRQLSDGFQYTDEAANRCDTPKDEALAKFLGQNEEVGRAMVFASYQESIDRSVELCQKEGWKVLRCDGRGWRIFFPGGDEAPDKATLAEWMRNLDRTQDPKTIGPLAIVGHPKSAGYGHNLTACREGCAYSLDFNWGDHAQAKKRGHREGMDVNKGFKMVYLCHLPTDRYVLSNHNEKRDLQTVTMAEIMRVLG